MSNSAKIKLYILIILIITIGVASRIGAKLEQQERLYNRNELAKLDAKLREQGVETCLIQPSYRSGVVYVMLSFWEKDEKVLKDKLDTIRATITEYTRKADKSLRTPVFKYYSCDGFPLDDIIQANLKVEIDETQPDYYEITMQFNDELRNRLQKSFNSIVGSTDYRMLIISDIKYDVTLNAHSPRQLFFFARFNDTQSGKLKDIRIQYKKLTLFNESRGDTIHFYNQKSYEFSLIDCLQREMARTQTLKDPKSATVVYEPINLDVVQIPEKQSTRNQLTPVPALTPQIIMTSPVPIDGGASRTPDFIIVRPDAIPSHSSSPSPKTTISPTPAVESISPSVPASPADNTKNHPQQ